MEETNQEKENKIDQQRDPKADNARRSPDASNNDTNDEMLPNHSKSMTSERKAAIARYGCFRWSRPIVYHASSQGVLRRYNQDAYFKHTIKHNPRVGQKRWNQDQGRIRREDFFERFLGAHETVLLGVLDGHGAEGHVYAQYVAENLPKLLEQELKLPKFDPPPGTLGDLIANADSKPSSDSKEEDNAEPPALPSAQNALVNAFHRVHEAAIQDPNIPSDTSGTTCIVLIVEDEYVHVGYVGDSRAIVIDVVERPNDKNDKMTATVTGITTWATEMTANNMPSERERITSNYYTTGGGRIECDGYVWRNGRGLAMTRALGDVDMAEAGVIPTPFTATYPRYLSDQDDPSSYRMVVMATDGVWNVRSNEQVANIVLRECIDFNDAAEAVVNSASQGWKAKITPYSTFYSVGCDDMTCLVFRL